MANIDLGQEKQEKGAASSPGAEKTRRAIRVLYVRPVPVEGECIGRGLFVFPRREMTNWDKAQSIPIPGRRKEFINPGKGV